MANTNLSAARAAKNDEFYTPLGAVEKEVFYYKDHLKDKVIYCNCDDPTWSKFYLYFKLKFQSFGLSKLITTHFVANGTSYKREFDGVNEIDTPLLGDGDFRSAECLAVLDTADVVITNPPFSLFREYVSLLVEKHKSFLVIGNMNAITYKDCFKLIKDNSMWLGLTQVKEFTQPDGSTKHFGNICWFTNLTHNKRNTPLDLYRPYSPSEYPKYDNYDAIEVSKVKDIPCDYNLTMGVPITFLEKYCPSQFEIVGSRRWFYDTSLGITNNKTILKGKETYDRLFIKAKTPVASLP